MDCRPSKAPHDPKELNSKTVAVIRGLIDGQSSVPELLLQSNMLFCTASIGEGMGSWGGGGEGASVRARWGRAGKGEEKKEQQRRWRPHPRT